MTVAKKIMMGSGAVALPSDDQFNRVSFLSHFDGANNGVNNAFDDSSSNNHTINNYGSPTQGSFGPFARPDGEWGVSFDGSGDYLTVADSTEFDLGTGNFTIEGWMNPAIMSGFQTIFSIGAPVQIYSYNNTVLAYFNDEDNTSTYSVPGLHGPSSSAPVNSWAHFAVVRNGNTFTAYVNGVAGSSITSSETVASSANVPAIGTYLPAATSYLFNGYISNLRLVKGTAVYTSNFTPSTSKLTAITNTKLLTCQSNRFVDNSASGHAITPSGNAAITSFGPFLTSSVYDPAVNGASSQLGGINSVEIPTGTWAQLGTGDFTWEYWIYPIVENNYHLGSGTSGQNASSTFTLGMSNKQLILYYTADGTAAHLLATSGTPEYNLNEWHHLAYVRAGNVHKIYANGILATSETRSGAMVNSTGPTIIGQFGTGSGVYGYGAEGIYCDVRLVKGTAVYSGSTYTVPTAPLTAISNTELLLNFKDGQAIDSAAQNNLTLDDNTKISNGQAKFGDTSLLFDGTTDYAKTIFNTSFGAGDFTIEYFFRVGSVSTNQNLFQFGGSFLPNDDGGPGLGIRTSRWRLYTGANTATHHGSAGPSNDTWYHIAVVRNGTTTKLYVDGVETISVSDSYDYSSRKHLLLGGGFDGSYDMNGYIDEFRVSHFARYTSNNFTVPSEPFADKGQDA